MTDNGTMPPAGGQHEIRDLTCEEALARVYEYLDGELGADAHEEVRQHLERCRNCYPYFDFERLFLDYIHEIGAVEESRPGLEARVRELLANEAG